ncbi:hypothetical protein Tco_0551040, partial [Tanacetum coccineum]
MSQSIPEQLNVDRREFADAVNALTKICSSHLVGSGAGIFSSAIAYTFLYFKEQGLKRCQQTPFDIKERGAHLLQVSKRSDWEDIPWRFKSVVCYESVNAPPINTEATTIITTIPEITPFISIQLRVPKLEQDMSEVKKTNHSAA